MKGDSIEGLQPIKLKQCFRCSNQNLEELELIEKKVEVVRGGDQEIVDYKIICKKCSPTFTIRLRNLYAVENGKKRRSITFVSVLDQEGRDEGWLGSF